MKKLLKKLTAVVSAAAVALTCLSFGGTVGLTAAAAEETVGAFTVTGGTSGTDYKYENNVLTILKETPLAISGTTTTDRIEVASGVSANITLAGVNISSAGFPAFKIEDNSTGNVTITLKDGTENTLKGGTYSAGLQKNGSAEGIGKLTIKGGTEGTGKLEATSSQYGGAGIGGSDNRPCSNIEICGGTVTATGGEGGAGIGGGRGNGSNITISGGTVTANGGYWGAGIGGGIDKAGSNITISGGTVTANGGSHGAGIGGGKYGSGSNITIRGGTVTANGGSYGAGIGGGKDKGTGSNIIITGGSVKAVAGSSANAIGGGYRKEAVTPTNGTNEVYLLTIANPDGAEVLIDGVSYTPVNHKAVDSNDGNLYVYLPAKTVAAPNVVKVGTEETKYVYDTKWLIVPTVTAPTAKTGLVYNGTAQELISAGSTDVGTLLYSLDGTNYSEDIPTATKADSYTVYYKVQGNDNVSDVDAKTVSASIGKADPVGDIHRNINVVSGVGTFTEPVFTGVDGQPLGGGVKYDESDYDQLVEYLKTLSNGNYNCLYEFTPNDRKNYNNVTGDISFYIYDVVFKVGNDDATAENAVTVKANPTYGDDWEDILTLNNGLKAVLFNSWNNALDDSEVTTGFSLDVTGSPNAGNDQEYNVLFTGTVGGKECTDQVVATGTVDVAKKELTVSAGTYKVSKVYDGTTAAGTGNDGKFEISGLVGTDSVTITPTIGAYSSADIGTSNVTVTISLTDDSGNYTLSNTTVSVPAEITPRSITPICLVLGTYTYTGSPIIPEVIVKQTGGGLGGVQPKVYEKDKDYTITVTDNINAGTGKVTFKPVSGGNYTFDEQTAYFTIDKATPNVTAPTAKTGLVYNGTAQELIDKGSTDFGTLLYSLDDTTYSTSIPTATNAGEYTVYYKVQGNSNVEDVAAEQITATIGKAEATVKAKNYTVKFGNPLPESLEYETDGLIGTDMLSSIGANVTIGYENAVTPSAIGNYIIVVSGSENTTNYELTYENGKLTIIEKPAQTITAADIELSYGDTGKKIGAATSGDGAISYAVASGDDVIRVAADGTITALKAGTATVEITAAETFDYAKATKTITVTVNKKKVAVPTADATEYTYNGKAQTYGVVSTDDYTVTGGTQTDAGNYPITITLNNENFEWDGVLGTYTFIIKKAAVTITANSYTVKVGNTLPKFDYKVSGLVNNEALPITVTVSCTAADSKTAGEYPITVSGADESVNYTFNYVDGTLTVQKKSSGGGGGGGNRPSTPTEPNNPSIGGSAKSWSEVAEDLAKLTTGSETTIQLNGNTTVPVEVIKVIADRDLKVTFVVDSVRSWKTDGAEITTPAAADLSIIATSKLKTDTLRGISGYQFSMDNTNIPTDLEIAFKTEHAGKFANLYKSVDGKLVFVTCAKLGADGKVILPDVVEKGDYVAMLCEFSDRLGDMSNDGILNALDASAVLKDIVSLAKGANPLMADFNGDGNINALDAAAILKRIVGLA